MLTLQLNPLHRSEWAARGFSDPATGYGRLLIHKVKPMIAPFAGLESTARGVP